MPDPAQRRQYVIAVAGPTATGKTRLGVSLAEYLGGEVISADSRIIYRELDIGTAKPTPAEMRGVPHHMIDVARPTEAFSAARYRSEAGAVLNRLLAEEKTPVVVGGTGFYLRTLLEPSFLPDVPPDEAFREKMAVLAEEKGSPWLYGLLAGKDPDRAAAVHPNDRFRIIRALEIVEKTGRPVPRSDQRVSSDQFRPYDVIWFGLYYENRDLLRARIDTRIEEMLAAGWLDEVKRLVAKYGPEAKALQVAHGYPELVQYLQGQLEWEEAALRMRINIHQYARRQMTWFRAGRYQNYGMTWFAVDEIPFEDIEARCRALLAERSGTNM